eukprot:5699546-Amphidinium_carterae.3
MGQTRWVQSKVSLSCACTRNLEFPQFNCSVLTTGGWTVRLEMHAERRHSIMLYEFCMSCNRANPENDVDI